MASFLKISRANAALGAFDRLRPGAALAASLLFLPWFAALGTEADVREAIRADTGLLRETRQLDGDGVQIAAPDLLAEIYERRDFLPEWQQPAKIEALLGVIRASYYEGLRPADYRQDDVEQLLQSVVAGDEISAGEQAARDMLLTDSLVRLVHDLHYGKANRDVPIGVWQSGRLPTAPDPAQSVQQVIDSSSISEAIAALTPSSTHYQRLRSQLQRHRMLAESGGWPIVPDGATIRPGDTDPRLAILARRLEISGDLADEDSPESLNVYDPVLQDAVRRFQVRHGLEADALIGPATLRALRVPVGRRIEQIRLNLERARWAFDSQDGDLVLVNIAGFSAYVIEDGRVVWATRVVVGEKEDQTPVIRSSLSYVVFNPTWTVPHSIASEEMLPKIRQDPQFLKRGNYELFDRAGNSVDPSGVDWSAVTTANFGFTLVQRPGSANELGQIKFIFPNEYSICMHDTPSKALFEKTERAFSHGCVRVDEPRTLAEHLLDKNGWTRQQIDAQIRSAKTRTVFLSEPLPVLLVYWTAEVDELGTIFFYDDIYARDAEVLATLDRPVYAQARQAARPVVR